MSGKVFERILYAGGDERITFGANGLSKYGCTPGPRNAIELGSSTSSSPSPAAFEAAREAWERLRGHPDGYTTAAETLLREVRGALREWLGNPPALGGIVLTPSGTDATLMALHFARAGHETLLNVVVAPNEVGSGTFAAAEGRHFSRRTPSGKDVVPGDPVDYALADSTRAVAVHLRDANGSLRGEEDVAAEIDQHIRVAREEGVRVLVHAIEHSKTGLRRPSESVLKRIQATGNDVGLLVDAAQGRIHQDTVVRHLEAGRMVLFTGSKFFGGPSFAGALLLPAGLPAHSRPLPAGYGEYFVAAAFPERLVHERASLAGRDNPGMILRWRAALCEIQRWQRLPRALRDEILKSSSRAVHEALSNCAHVTLLNTSPPVGQSGPPIESVPTVFCLGLQDGRRALGKAALARLHEWLNRPSAMDERTPSNNAADAPAFSQAFHLGQPVTIAPGNMPRPKTVLRVALGAPLLIDIAENSRLGISRDARLRWFEDKLEGLVQRMTQYMEDCTNDG